MHILFEDNDIVVCVKPYGVISQSAANGEDMVAYLSAQLCCDVYPVHRLDRETGGVMVYAKNTKAAAKLCSDVSKRKMQKEYFVLLHGAFQSVAGELRDLLFRDKQRNKSYVVKRARKGVKEAVLQYETVKTVTTEMGEISFLKVKLITGRTHQIRVQFASRGFPLLGDNRYGAGDTLQPMGLWAYSLTFRHPKTGETLEFTAQPTENSLFEKVM